MADCPVNHTGLCVDGWAGNCTADRCKLTEQPTIFDLIAGLRRTVGLFDGAMPITPQQAWEEALREVRRLRRAAEAPR